MKFHSDLVEENNKQLGCVGEFDDPYEPPIPWKTIDRTLDTFNVFLKECRKETLSLKIKI